MVHLFVWWGLTNMCTHPQLPRLVPHNFGAKFGPPGHSVGFDGRQIRNIVTSALRIARAEGEDKLTKAHLRWVVFNVKDFKDEFRAQFQAYQTEQAGGGRSYCR